METCSIINLSCKAHGVHDYILNENVMRVQNVCHIKTSVKRYLESKNFVTFAIKTKIIRYQF